MHLSRLTTSLLNYLTFSWMNTISDSFMNEGYRNLSVKMPILSEISDFMVEYQSPRPCIQSDNNSWDYPLEGAASSKARNCLVICLYFRKKRGVGALVEARRQLLPSSALYMQFFFTSLFHPHYVYRFTWLESKCNIHRESCYPRKPVIPQIF